MLKAALHTAEVSAGEDQSENEASYGGYARVEPTDAGVAQFPILTSGQGEFYTHVSIADDDGVIIDVMELTPPSLGQTGSGPMFSVSEIL